MVDLLNWRLVVIEADRAAVGQEEDVVEVVIVVELRWAGLLMELVVSQLHVEHQPVELAVDVLFVDHEWLMSWKNRCRCCC